MKYIALALLGLVSVQAIKVETSIAQFEQNKEAEFAEMSDSDNEVEDSLVQLDKPCVYLDETTAELDHQVDLFSKTLDTRHWTNAVNIQSSLKGQGKSPKLYVHTWELLDKAFDFPRVRRYQFVRENLDLLEHF
jgi:hypothetical protein